MKIRLYDLILFLLPISSFASAKSTRDPMTLFWGGVLNLSIVVGFFIWKGVPALKEYFNEKHDDIAAKSKKAQANKFEAQMLLEKQEKKNSSLDQEIEGIKKSAQDEVAAFQKHKEEESESQINNLRNDIVAKVEVAKNEVVNNINKDLINEILSKAKVKVGGNLELKEKIIKQITRGLE